MSNCINSYDMYHWDDEYWFADFAELLALGFSRTPANHPHLYKSAAHKPSVTDRPP